MLNANSKWHVACPQGIGVYIANGTQSKNLLHVLSTLKLFGSCICFPSDKDTHKVGGYWIVVEVWQHGVLRVFGLKHYIWLHHFQWFSWLWKGKVSYKLFGVLCNALLLQIKGCLTSFTIGGIKEILDHIEVCMKNEKHRWDKLIIQCFELHHEINIFKSDGNSFVVM